VNVRNYITVADGVLVAALVVLAGVLFFLMPRWVLSGGTDVEIRANGRMVGRYSLDADRVVEVPGPLGKTLVRIKGGRARVESSPCRDKICEGMGEVGREGGVIVCIPNKVVVGVEKRRSDGLDAVAR